MPVPVRSSLFCEDEPILITSNHRHGHRSPIHNREPCQVAQLFRSHAQITYTAYCMSAIFSSLRLLRYQAASRPVSFNILIPLQYPWVKASLHFQTQSKIRLRKVSYGENSLSETHTKRIFLSQLKYVMHPIALICAHDLGQSKPQQKAGNNAT